MEIIKSQRENKDRQRLKGKFIADYTIKGKISSLLLDNMYGKINDKMNRLYTTSLIDDYLSNHKSKKFEFEDGTMKEISSWIIICNETNNTPDIINKNKFRFDIYLNPARNISNIILKFEMVPTIF